MNLPRSLKVSPLNLFSSTTSSKLLPFSIQHQQQKEWCWAAVAVSVNKYYNPESSWIQCKLVNQLLGQSTCCEKGGSSSCNKPYYLNRALDAVGNLLRWEKIRASFTEVKNQIDASRPLCARIGWTGGGGRGHFVVSKGYIDTSSTQYLFISDPWFGPSIVKYSSFLSSYKGRGAWTTTYWTKG